MMSSTDKKSLLNLNHLNAGQKFYLMTLFSKLIVLINAPLRLVTPE
ncbi:hypothetical protein PTUN_a3084 [Pseudoalteromonas tunicata]|nr:hypothetical protein PTUN_a3084 [Pseudoalteromonas tunicata]